MATVTITITDTGTGDVSVESNISDMVSATTKIEDLSNAQAVALTVLEYIDDSFGEDPEDHVIH